MFSFINSMPPTLKMKGTASVKRASKCTPGFFTHKKFNPSSPHVHIRFRKGRGTGIFIALIVRLPKDRNLLLRRLKLLHIICYTARSWKALFPVSSRRKKQQVSEWGTQVSPSFICWLWVGFIVLNGFVWTHIWKLSRQEMKFNFGQLLHSAACVHNNEKSLFITRTELFGLASDKKHETFETNVFSCFRNSLRQWSKFQLKAHQSAEFRWDTFEVNLKRERRKNTWKYHVPFSLSRIPLDLRKFIRYFTFSWITSPCGEWRTRTFLCRNLLHKSCM